MNDEQKILELGIVLGQRRAFGTIAGRCSAAHAECLRKVREEKVYLRFAATWDEYCERHLQISSRTADRVIAQLKELGTIYFEAAALTGITPPAFRAIRSAIDQDGIHVDNEVIALIPANADRAVAAVARLQAQAKTAAAPAATASSKVAALEKRGSQLADSFRRAARESDQFEREWLLETVEKVRQMLGRVKLENGRV